MGRGRVGQSWVAKGAGRGRPALHAGHQFTVHQERGPSKRPTGHKWPLDLSEKSEDPWRDLFLWAVLQNRHEMATYFWAMVSHALGTHVLEGMVGRGGPHGPLTPFCQGQESVAAALVACKILKEMAHLETAAEAARTLQEAKYEQLALGE